MQHYNYRDEIRLTGGHHLAYSWNVSDTQYMYVIWPAMNIFHKCYNSPNIGCEQADKGSQNSFSQ